VPLYQNTQELIDFLKAHQLWNKKSLGQNFLVNLEVLEQIIKTAEITKNDQVVEIGAGLGVLTEKLLEKAAHVRAIEYDSTLIPMLQKTFSKSKNLELLHADALKIDPPDYPYKLVANIPYYITSPLLNHYLQTQKRPDIIVFLVQKEVAEKICAEPGDHSILSLQVQIFGNPKMIAQVGKSSFFPQPKVDSAILKIEVFQEPVLKNTRLFFKLIKAAFSQKRKTLLNSLRSANLELGREEISDLLNQAGIEPNRRPQSLSLEEWGRLVLLIK
jgi:16S rRNA (adenine1518-N6/adenine1519-N6)-dimethyltransferase